MSNVISYEEATRAVPKEKPKSDVITYEEAIGSTAPPTSHPGPLARAEGDSEAMKMVKGAATTLLRGGAGIVGGIGDLHSLGDMAYAGLKSLPKAVGLEGKGFSENLANLRESQKNFKDRARESGLPVLPEAPTSEDVRNAVLRHTGEYVAESAPGRVAMGAGELATAMLGPQAGMKVTSLVGSPIANLARDFVTGAGAGAGAGVAKEIAPDSTGAQIAGSVAGGFLPSVAKGIVGATKPLLMPESSAQGLAGKVLRDSAEKAETAVANMGRTPSSVAATGVSPNTANLAGDRGIDSLEAAARSKDPALAAALDAQTSAASQKLAEAAGRVPAVTANADASKALAGHAVDDAASNVAGHIPNTTKAEASARAREYFDRAMERAKTDVDSAWDAMRGMPGAMFMSNVVSQAKEGFKGINDVVMVKELNNLVDKYVTEWKAAGISRDISPDMVNPLRSRLLEDARTAARAGRGNEARMYNQAADSVLDAMSNQKNWLFRDDRARHLWDDARVKSREFHKTFKDDVLAPLSRETTAGVERVAEGATLSRIMSGDPAQAASNVKQFLQATGYGSAKDVFDFMYGKMTNNREKKVTVGSIDKFMAEQGPVIKEVPGLEDHLRDLRDLAQRHGTLSSSVGNLMFEGRDPASAAKYLLGQRDPARAARDVHDFGRMIGGADGRNYVDGVQKAVIDQLTADPSKIGGFLDKNSSMVRNLFPDRAQAEAIVNIRNADRIINRAPDVSFSNLKSFENLTGGRILDLLVGSAQSKVIGAGAGYMAGSAAAKMGVPNLATALELIGAVVGASGGVSLASGLYGGTAERAKQILGEALKNPKTAALLMQKATPGAWGNMMKSFPQVAQREAGMHASTP